MVAPITREFDRYPEGEVKEMIDIYVNEKRMHASLVHSNLVAKLLLLQSSRKQMLN